MTLPNSVEGSKNGGGAGIAGEVKWTGETMMD